MIYLASQSPRRRLLLEQLGVLHQVVEIDLDERRHLRESPEKYVQRMAVSKAQAGRAAIDPLNRRPVLGADTIVVLGDEVLGKPTDTAHAEELLSRLSGRCHTVLTAVALATDKVNLRVSATRVWFRRLSSEDLRQYCATGESLDKAGAYAVQGMAAAFIARLDGSYSGVMGLPLYETSELLADAGVPVFAQTNAV